jgi:hypothetical protein
VKGGWTADQALAMEKTLAAKVLGRL